MKNSTIIIAHLALFIVQLLYAANYTIAKEVMPDYIAPKGIIFIRICFAVLMFWLLHAFFIKAEEIKRKDIPRLVLCGIFGVVINQICFFVGLNWTKPINASIIMQITPILVFIGTVFFLKEKFRLLNILGILIGCAGAALLIGYGQNISFSTQGLKGDLYILINAISYSVYFLIVKPLLQKYHPIVVVKWIFTFGLLFATPFTLPEMLQTEWNTLSPAIWGALAYILIGATFLTYLLNALALSRLSPKVVGAYIYLQPILATIIAVLAGKDELTTIKMITGMMIFVGVYLVSLKK